MASKLCWIKFQTSIKIIFREKNNDTNTNKVFKKYNKNVVTLKRNPSREFGSHSGQVPCSATEYEGLRKIIT